MKRLRSRSALDHEEEASTMATEDTEAGASFLSMHSSLPEDNTSEGYDNEFIEPVDNKYECPICLMCLREPQQTDCGHRYCKNCITKWLGGTERKCPACNEMLEVKRVYPDNFAKREILSLMVKCHFNKAGCDFMGPLRQVVYHQVECQYQTRLCPNRCGESLKLIDMQDHLEKGCPYRQVECSVCRQNIQSQNIESHKLGCAMSANICRMCGGALNHANSSEPHVCLRDAGVCQFHRFGCSYKAPKTHMEKHMKDYVSQHLSLLSAVTERLLDERPTHEVRILSERMSNLQATHQIAEDEELDEIGELKKPKLKPTSSLPLGACGGDEEVAGPSGSNTNMKSKVQYHSGEYLVATDSSVAAELRNRVADQTQHILELSSKQQLLESLLQEARKEVRDIRMDMLSRCCNGNFIWRLHNYSRLREDSRQGVQNNVLHSPGFFTSFSGYQFCMRLNLNGVEDVQGTHISLFIHLMKSENDDILTWPFSGKITLSILDQNDLANKRNHITETLIAKPGLAAFQRPTAFRNHKGFGYMEFAPFEYLEKPVNYFIKNDTLIIRAEVKPTSL